MHAAAEATPEDRARLVQRLAEQARSAELLGSPLYRHLLAHVSADVEECGPCWQVLRPFAHQPNSQALPLRFMAAVHRLVLRRQAPRLALHYASVGGTAGLDGSWEAFREVVSARLEDLVELTARPCQTNEVGRSAALGAGLAWLAGRQDLPLHHYEIGTSAGLNLRWDHFRYGTADRSVTWGPADSPVDLVGHWLDPPRGLPSTVGVATRAGCDPAALDPSSAEDRETLTAAVWGDMADRHARLEGALALAAAIPARVDRVGAGTWLGAELPRRPEFGLTVVTHSVVWRYVPAEEREQITDTFAAVGASATTAAPLVWLRLEPRPPKMVYDGAPYPLLATTWPGGETEELASAQAHGQELRWTAA